MLTEQADLAHLVEAPGERCQDGDAGASRGRALQES